MKKNNLKTAINYVKSRYGIKKQKDLCEELGITATYISNVINGTFPLTDLMLDKFKEKFSVNPEFITGDSDKMWLDTDKVMTTTGLMDRNTRIDAVVSGIKAKYNIDTQADICKAIGVGATYLSDIKKGRYKIRKNVMWGMSHIFGVNPEYIDGESDEMWLSDQPSVSVMGNNNTTVSGNDNTVTQADAMITALNEIAEQRKLVSRSQEQIDRLLNIIENFQKNGTEY